MSVVDLQPSTLAGLNCADAAAPDGPCLSSPCVQEFSFYCPPRLRQARRRFNKRALDSKSALPEFDCQTPAAKRARLTHLATTRDVSRGTAPEDMVCHRHRNELDLKSADPWQHCVLDVVQKEGAHQVQAEL